MNYFGSASTDVGIVKKTNQDSACIKIAEFKGKGKVVLALICDGMGGLSKGELASATVIRRFSYWFENELPNKISNITMQAIANEWTKMIREQNEKLLNYGKAVGANLGTTFSGMFIMNDEYVIVHVGDSRIYEISNNVKQLTEDQTYINREMKAGRMTPQEAATDPKRNMLLQCVGASRVVNPDVAYGKIMPDTVYMLCSDGFRHVLSDAEMYENFNSANINSVNEMKKNSDYLIDVVKRRNERDNITVALLKSVI